MARKKKSRRSFGSIRERNGKYEASYKRDGKTHYGPNQFLDRTSAQLWLNGEEQLMLEGRWTPKGEHSPLNTTWTFGKYAAHYIETQTTANGTHLRPSVKELYYSYLRRGLACFADLTLDEISSEQVDDWYREMTLDGKLSTASKHYKLLRAVMARAVDTGYRTLPNPCQVRGAQNASSKRDLFTPSMDEVGRIARAINPRFGRLMLVMANAGLRFGELAALTCGDVEKIYIDGVPRITVKVQRAMTRLKGNQIHIGPPKSAHGVRDMILHSALTKVIEDQIASLADNAPNALLFPAANGGYLRNDVLNKAMKGAAKRAGMDPNGVSPHAFRRGGATELANTGANVAEVKDYLGDASEQAALRYIKSTGRTASLVEAMNTGSLDQEGVIDQ